jgi:hypothetical protein
MLLGCQSLPNSRPWLGFTMTLEKDAFEFEGRTYAHGIRVRHVMTGAPGQLAGLRHGDIIVGAEGISFDVPSDQLLTHFTESVAARRAGEKIHIHVLRDGIEKSTTLDGQPLNDPPADIEEFLRQKPPGPTVKVEARRRKALVTIEATLANRPSILAPRGPMPDEKPNVPDSLYEPLVSEFGNASDYEELRSRFEALQAKPDPFRLSIVAQAQRYPFAMPELSQSIVRRSDLRGAASLLGHPLPELALPKLALDKWEKVLDRVEVVFEKANQHRERAFSRLSSEERTFLFEQLDAFGSAMIQATYLQSDTDSKRLEANLKLIQLAALVDFSELFAAAQVVSSLFNLSGEFFALPDVAEGVLASRETKFGRFLICGNGKTWHKEDAAFILDLGGDDLYTNNAGASRKNIPIAVVIDLSGNDAYESSVPWCQAAGRLGIGALYDAYGDDAYLGQRWAQGVGAFGVGILNDSQGRDTFRADEFSQGAAVFGIGLASGGLGDDRYTAARFAQGFAASGAVGCLHDVDGDDRYYCKGRQPTSFGDRGIFEGWGQGCGTGIRGVASGGIGILRDDSGQDTYEGGNYTQGGGFYFGWGICFDSSGNDRYVASRWGQGFAAHQAIGFCEDLGGNDTYIIRQGGGQSFAWEESVTALFDRDGDDLYQGGRFHCQGASAHNGFSLFVDQRGKDRYDYEPGPGLAGPNDYHGGTSLSIFIDEGEGDDVYSTESNNRKRTTPGNGIFIDK